MEKCTVFLNAAGGEWSTVVFRESASHCFNSVVLPYSLHLLLNYVYSVKFDML